MKEKILRATAKIISANGFESASTRAICEAVGITAPTLYYHFRCKSDLLAAVTQFAFNLQREHKNGKRTDDALLNLRLFWNEFMQFSVAEPELHRTMMLSISQGSIVQTAYGCFSDLVLEFKNLNPSGVLAHSPLQSAQMYLGAAQGISLIILALPDKATSNALSISTREIILAGLIKH